MLIPASVVLFPAVADVVASGDRARLRLLGVNGLEGAIAVVLPLVAVIAAGREPLTRLLFGDEYVGAAGPLALLAPAFGLLAIANVVAAVTAAAGKPHDAMRVAAGALFVQLAIAAPLTLASGLDGAATATLIAAAICCTAELAVVRRTIGALGDPTRVLRLALAAAAAFGIASLADSRIWIVPMTLVALGVYAVLIVLLRVVPRSLTFVRPPPGEARPQT